MSPTNPSTKHFLRDLPAETILSIMEELPPWSLANFALSAKQYLWLYNSYKVTTMRRMVQNLPESKLQLLLHTAGREELQPSRMFCPRVIIYTGEEKKITLMDVDVVPEWFSGVPVPKFGLVFTDIQEIWKRAEVVDWWCEVYCRVRWRNAPEDRRPLRPHEQVRLRMAIVRWWLFSHYHHGLVYRHRTPYHPKRWERCDTRLMHIRYLSTSEIWELRDFFCRVRDTVSKDLCTSPERVCLCKDGYGVDLVPWSQDQGRHSKIVRTYMKLDPEQLRYYLTNYPNWKRTTTISAVTTACRSSDFSRDAETLSVSINKVLEERMAAKGIQDWSSLPRFGILDEDRASEQDHAEWLHDAWPDGHVPQDVDERLRGLPSDTSSLVCRGDDGTDEFIPF
ncbi:hypothetical protein F5Y13DRAFT_47355 [Hypoxylon sp. FL1857]|nr:hypothetical protein F5Y13DRAFT_47355 [Hypoxylon sp. FL1857]